MIKDVQSTLFEQDVPAVIRSFPKRGTLMEELLNLLLTGESVTQPEWLQLTESWRLAATVQALEVDHGWQIISADIPAPSRRKPHRMISKYRLSQADIMHGRTLMGQREAA